MNLKLGLLLIVGVFACFGLIGCGKPTKAGAQVSGTVTLDGAPLPNGVIHFDAVGGGVSTATPIEQGKYTFPEGNGLTAGKYKVAIHSGSPPVVEADPDKAMEMASRPAPPEKILPKYNTATELTADIKTDAPNVIDFAVTSK